MIETENEIFDNFRKTKVFYHDLSVAVEDCSCTARMKDMPVCRFMVSV